MSDEFVLLCRILFFYIRIKIKMTSISNLIRDEIFDFMDEINALFTCYLFYK